MIDSRHQAAFIRSYTQSHIDFTAFLPGTELPSWGVAAA